MKKKNVKKWVGAFSLALAMSMFSGTVMAEETSEFVRGDITGDGYIGTEDVVYSSIVCMKYPWPGAIPTLPQVVEFQKDACDVDENGEVSMFDTWELMKAVTGESEWGVGKHKITSSDKTDVLYRHDGDYIIAYVKVKKWIDTAIIYDNTKVEYVELENVERKVPFIHYFDNKELGYGEIVAVSPYKFTEPIDKQYGTIKLKFKKLTDSDDITFASCTGAGYIKDNMKEGESFTEAAKRYEDALYKEGYIINDKVELEEAQRALKMSLKIMQVKSDDGWNADINEDGQVTLEDAQKYLRLALNIDEI